MLSPLRKIEKQKMPPRHKDTKVHQDFRFQINNFGVTWSLGVLVAKKYFSEWTQCSVIGHYLFPVRKFKSDIYIP